MTSIYQMMDVNSTLFRQTLKKHGTEFANAGVVANVSVVFVGVVLVDWVL